MSQEQAARDLAELVHLHHAGYDEDLPYWLALARRHANQALELGCGSGRVLLALARAGIAVFGIDNDPAALAILRRAAQPARPALLQADFTTLPLGGRFSFIFMPCNTYSTLDSAARNRLLGRLRACLAPGGVFAASLPNPAALASLTESEPEEEETFLHPRTGNPVQLSSGWARAADELVITWHYDHLLPDGRVERLTAAVRHQPLTAQQLRAEMEAHGFRVILFGDFDGSDYAPDSPYLIFEAS
ncbi:MAG: class I SAM-dependent methyltransferase [Chloroflexi bacterium]|nr:class I SAM-dependent methyltransferase [Chloroflexota bacterium]